MATELNINYSNRDTEKMVRALELAGPIVANALPGPQDTLPLFSSEHALVEISLDAVGRLISIAGAFSHTFLDQNNRDNDFSKFEIFFRSLIKSPARYAAIRYAPTIISRLASNHESLSPLGWGVLAGFAILTGYEIANTAKGIGKNILPITRSLGADYEPAKTESEQKPSVDNGYPENTEVKMGPIRPVPDEISLKVAMISKSYEEVAEKIRKSRNSEEYINARLAMLESEKSKKLYELLDRK